MPVECRLQPLGHRDVVRRRPYRDRLERGGHLACDRVELGDPFDVVAEEPDPQRPVRVRREDVEHVAAHTERAAHEVVVVAVVLDVDERGDQMVAVQGLAHGDERRLTRVVLRRPDAVDAAHGRDDDDVLARQQRRRGRVPQLLDLSVDRGVLLDEGVGRRDVRFRLVVVVVGDEVDDRVVRQQVRELGRELRGERLVRRHHERRLLDLFDDLRHREGLARAGDAEQGLVPLAGLDRLGEAVDRLGLIAGGLVGRHDLEFLAHLASSSHLTRKGR